MYIYIYIERERERERDYSIYRERIYKNIYIHIYTYIFLNKYILLIMLLHLSQFFPLCPSSAWYPPFLQQSLPPFMSMDCTCKFFGYSIFHTILNNPLSILYLPIILLIPCTFFPIVPLPAHNPPNDFHTYDPVSVLGAGLICFFSFSC